MDTHSPHCSCFDCNIKHDRCIDEKSTAAILRLSPYTLQKWRVKGCGPKFQKYGRSVRYRARDLVEFMDRSTHRSTSDAAVNAFIDERVAHEAVIERISAVRNAV